MKKYASVMAVFLPLFLGPLNTANASETLEGTEVYGVKISSVRAYELGDNKPMSRIFVNGQAEIGPNPSYPGVSCELWTYNQNVIDLAKDARNTDSTVTIRYTRGPENDSTHLGPVGPKFCQVQFINHS